MFHNEDCWVIVFLLMFNLIVILIILIILMNVSHYPNYYGLIDFDVQIVPYLSVANYAYFDFEIK